METEKEIQNKNILTAREEAIKQLNLYIKEQKEEYLQKSFELDNTNSNIIYSKLTNLNKKNEPRYKELSQKYRLFLNEEDARKLNISYVDHKKDVLEIFHSIQKMDPLQPKDIVILKESLYKYYPKEDKNILELDGKERINNLPLNLYDDDLMFFLKVKIKLGEHLYNFVDELFGAIIKEEKENEEEEEKDEEEEEKDKDYKKKKEENAIYFYKSLVPYIKVYTEIILYYIIQNDKKLVYCLLSKVDFTLVTHGAKKQVGYYLNKMKANYEEISNKTGFEVDSYKTFDYSSEEKIYKLPDNYQQLFFETIEKILKSNCIKQLINELVTHHKDDKKIIIIDDNYIKYIKENILFHKFFDFDDYGFTNVIDGTIFINTHFNYVDCLQDNENQLFIFCLMIITGIHEIIGHFLKDYYYYSTKFYISDESPVKEGKKEEGGFLVEDYLFKKIKKIYISDVLYILDISNWDKNLYDFNQFFTSKLRENIITKGFDLNTFTISEECAKLILNFNIKKENLDKIRTDVSVACRKKNVNNSKYMQLSKTRCSNDKKNKNFVLLKNYKK